ncbi:MAG: PAS domain-containing sensor histidine kinase [Flavobacteriaceae bacterium]
MNFLAQKRSKIFQEQTNFSSKEKTPFDNFYYQELAKLTASGSWSVNFREKKSYLDPEARRILKTPNDFVPSLSNAMDFYAPEHQDFAAKTFYECSHGKPFSVVIKMLTYQKKSFWVKAVGAPVYDDFEEIIGIQGVFQDINEEKLKELSLEKSLQVIESQNSRMFNFAYIVSHNLRSHASNLNLTLELLKDANPEDEKDLKSNLYAISESLNTTMEHLNEIVSAQNKSLKEKQVVRFTEILNSVKNSLRLRIQENEVDIFSEFSEVPEIEYIPFYMESIFMNLISNAIKYGHPDRKTVIDIYTYFEDNKPCLMIKDNGLGIDLKKYGDKVFHMYQTFHDREDAVGIGLFIVKNQVEMLQGSIEVMSAVDVGTTFIIRF